jgi:hypothetical protein
MLGALAVAALLGPGGSVALAGQAPGAAGEVTFTRDIAPILQRSCQKCHRPDGVAPMSLVTYEEVRPWSRAIKTRTGLGPRAGVMPPWYIEKTIGIQHFKNDPSLSDDEIARIAKWSDSGAPRGNPSDLPPPLTWDDASKWAIGTPDLIVKTKEILVNGVAPDWWGEIESVPTGLTEDRYVTAVEVKEVNDVPPSGSGRATVGGRYVFHHLVWSTTVLDDGGNGQAGDPADGVTTWPVHEVGREADFFDLDSARLLKANSHILSDSAHLHSNGRDTKAHLLIAFKFAPKGFVPKYKRSPVSLGTTELDIRSMEANQQAHAYVVLPEHTKILSFEPHLHAPGMRMCMEAIWGAQIQTINCAGYDHSWVRGYNYKDDYAPLLPKGTILHIIGYMDNSPTNKNVPDPRNWQGSGNRSVANMLLDLGNKVSLTEEQFQEEMARRRERLKLTRNTYVIGCPLCMVSGKPGAPKTQQQQP